MKEFFSIEEHKLGNNSFFILLCIAFIFSVGVRYIWVYQFGGFDSYYWNGQLMINTNDGYYWAEGARDILAGFHQTNDLSPIERSLSKLTAFLAHILPISFETLILWMPAFFGSLLIVPIMLIGRLFKQDIVGFIAALLGGIAWSYYNRTMVGYYDTDLLIVVLPTFMMWGVLLALKTQMNRYLIIAPIFAVLSIYWHEGTANIINSTFFIVLLYTIIFERKNIYYYKFLSIFILAMSTLSVSIKLVLILIVVAGYYFFKEKLTDKIIIAVVAISTFIYLFFGGIDWIEGVLSSGYFTRALHADDLNLSLHYYSVVNTVREAGHIPFEIFANRISGNIITFWLSVIGYLVLIIRYRLFILTLPMVGLGFFALQGGLRFTVFAVPFMALGISYLIVFVASKIKFEKKEFRYGFVAILTTAILYPNITHVISYKVPTVMTKDEVEILDKLKKISSREDYVMTWWDYGYPIRYYADVKTLIDGGKHSGGDNFPTSFALMHNQIAAANMIRMDVEFTERNFKEHCGDTSFECMLKASNIKNPERFLEYIDKKGINLPKKTRDVYLFLPNRMMNILPTIDLFSNLNLMTGQQYRRPMFYVARPIGNIQGGIQLNNGMVIRGGSIISGNKTIPLNQLIVTEYDTKGILHKNVQHLNIDSPVYAIYMRNYNKFLILDKRVFDSTYIQLFVLENYDKELYEPVFLTPYAKIYKLKI